MFFSTRHLKSLPRRRGIYVAYVYFMFQEDIAEIFKVADKDNSGTLTIEEFKDVIEDITIRYPQVELYLQNNHLSNITDLLKDANGKEREEVDIEEFKLALSNVDKQTKSLPATAQVSQLILTLD